MEEDAVKKAALSMGYTSLRVKQKEAILGFIRGRDVFVSLPTGSGKSLCNSILPIVFDTLKKKSRSIVLVISPLISLMKDQIRSLDSKGITATLVSKSSTPDDGSAVEQTLYEGGYQIIFFSPEALLGEETWRDLLQTQVYKKNVVALVVDEAHLVKKW